MDKKDKLILGAILLLVIFLFGIVIFASFRIASIETNYQNLATSVKNIQVVNGKDGIDGENGLDGSNGLNGLNGKDAISTQTIEKYFTQLPPEKGEDGKAGKDAQEIQIQINPETKDLETKKSDERYWTLLVPCVELLRSCPNTTIGIGNE